MRFRSGKSSESSVSPRTTPGHGAQASPGSPGRQPGSREAPILTHVEPQPSPRPAVTARLTAWLAVAGVPFRVLEHAPVRTSAEAAAVRGTPLEAGAKALVVRADDRPVHIVLPADRRIDNARLRALLGTRRLRFVTPDELLTLTGCAPGAVPPFGNLFGLEVLVDEELTRGNEIAFNAGSRDVSITMRCADFIRLAGARIARFAQS
jgi:Ala-tRNA(Pro) deacylase